MCCLYSLTPALTFTQWQLLCVCVFVCVRRRESTVCVYMCVNACTRFPHVYSVWARVFVISASLCAPTWRAHIIAVFQLQEQMLGVLNTGAKTVPEASVSNENVPVVLW